MCGMTTRRLFIDGTVEKQQAGVKLRGRVPRVPRSGTSLSGGCGRVCLSKEDALESVTLYPEQILGVADSWGRSTRKVANVVVTRRSRSLERTHTFLEGASYADSRIPSVESFR